METKSSVQNTAARLFIAALVVTIMVIAKSFLVPLAWAVMIAMASYPLLNRLEAKTRMPRTLINMLFLLFLLICLLSIGFFFFLELSHIFKDLPALAHAVSEKLHDMSDRLDSMGIAVPDQLDKEFISNWVQSHNNIVMQIISGIGLNLWNIILIMFYMFFLLYYRDIFIQFFTARMKGARQMVSARSSFNKSLDVVRNYLYGMLVLTLISAVMNYAVFAIFGLKYALFFAMFLAVLNLVPFVGNPIGLVVIMLFAFITKDGLTIPLLIFIALFIANFLQDNVIRPWVMGDKMKLNAFAVFLSIIVGGMIWGVSGMILFIPIAGIAKIVLEHSHTHHNYALLFGEMLKSGKNKPGESNEAE